MRLSARHFIAEELPLPAAAALLGFFGQAQ
jgi:hypothetical protein